ncbi:hypothetical protein DL240_10800 [Lujinxingia litoralis]|uniref:PEGA domain-containing protein n=1 Tax=Lujinxingia litoralis TaxID=2211119 RepID=A0A328C7F1_9DELT|nr:hypothetical protein [Lujinxingia litoralis]RAL22330.1 hypothetical protein DL240_10800 [Lujinxingia litoralis]
MQYTKCLTAVISGCLVMGLASAATAQEVPSENPIEALQRANRLANAGAWTRSVPHYEAAIQRAGEQFPVAYFNLAEVLRAKNLCERAVLFYQSYLDRGEEADVLEESRAGVEACRQGGRAMVAEGKETPPEEGPARWVKVRLKVDAQGEGSVQIDGIPMFFSGQERELWMRSGTYALEVALVDHDVLAREVVIGVEPTQEVVLTPERMLFHGSLMVEVDRPGARVRVEPRELDSPTRANVEPFTLESPWEEVRELPTGTYFIEVTLDEHHRWIRNVEVERERQAQVNVRLRRMLPAAIRPGQ